MTPRLFIDMDGVLADFEGHYRTHFGVTLDRHAPDPGDLWANLKTRPTWFEDLPVLPGALDFFRALAPYRPTLLSGLSRSLPDAHAQKRRWADKYLGPDVPLITCPAHRKRDHGRPGDILVDDWSRYRDKWEKMGGTFVLHDAKNPAASVAAVTALLGPALT